MATHYQHTHAAFIRQTIGDDEYIHVFGEVDTDSDDEFRAAIIDAARTAKRVVVDLTRCTYIGSQGFAVLVNARSLTAVAVVAPERVKRLIDAIGLTDFLIAP